MGGAVALLAVQAVAQDGQWRQAGQRASQRRGSAPRASGEGRGRNAPGELLRPADIAPPEPGPPSDHQSTPAPAAGARQSEGRGAVIPAQGTTAGRGSAGGTAADQGTEGGSAPDGTGGKGAERGGSGTATGPQPK